MFAKNIVLGSLGTHFMHIRVKRNINHRFCFFFVFACNAKNLAIAIIFYFFFFFTANLDGQAKVASAISSVKVAFLANIKLAFMDWLYYYLIIFIKQCKISYKNSDKSLLFSRNQLFFLKNRKFWRAPTTIELNILYWNFAHVSYFPISTKECSGFFFFFFISWVIWKNLKDLVSTYLLFRFY